MGYTLKNTHLEGTLRGPTHCVVVVHDVVLDLGGHLAMYMLGLVLLDVDGCQGFRSAQDPIVDARKDITLKCRKDTVKS